MLPASNIGDTAVISAASRHFLNSTRSLNKDGFKIEGRRNCPAPWKTWAVSRRTLQPVRQLDSCNVR